MVIFLTGVNEPGWRHTETKMMRWRRNAFVKSVFDDNGSHPSLWRSRSCCSSIWRLSESFSYFLPEKNSPHKGI
jgi:hypothetical protein